MARTKQNRDTYPDILLSFLYFCDYRRCLQSDGCVPHLIDELIWIFTNVVADYIAAQNRINGGRTDRHGKQSDKISHLLYACKENNSMYSSDLHSMVYMVSSSFGMGYKGHNFHNLHHHCSRIICILD